ncbi:hypothetical protein NKH18_49425 [Streptomyces sp. M10(2022)]
MDLTPAEIRRLLAAIHPRPTRQCDHTMNWSRWRRRHQARAQARCE